MIAVYGRLERVPPRIGEAGAAKPSSDRVAVMEDINVKPVITVPKGEPPADLMIEDLVEGDGPEATAGMQVTVDYMGINWSNGREFDASWNRNDTFSFGLGAGMVIPGWDHCLLYTSPSPRDRG